MKENVKYITRSYVKTLPQIMKVPSHQLFTMELWVQSQDGPCGICCRKNGPWGSLLAEDCGFLLPHIILPVLHNQGLVQQPFLILQYKEAYSTHTGTNKIV